jgi:hypothetical protein
VRNEKVVPFYLFLAENIQQTNIVESHEVEEAGLLSTDTTLVVEGMRPKAISRPLAEHGKAIMPSEFLKRPVIVSTIQWTTGYTYSDINPFQLWFNNAVVLAHLQGVGKIRLNLRVRVEVSASAYSYGKAAVCWRPGINAAQNALQDETAYSIASSRLGVEVDAAVPGVKEFVIPWCDPRDAVPTEATGQFANFGFLRFHNAVYNRVGGAVGDSTVIISVWPEQLWLWAPTRKIAIAQSSGPGPVQRAADRVGGIMKTLSVIPGMGGAAEAGRAVASAVGSVSSLFGWTRGSVEPKGAQLYTARRGNLSVTDAADTASLLAFTSDVTRAVDFDDMGVEDDEMALSTLFTRKGLVTSYSMTIAQPVGTVIGTLAVSPTLSGRTQVGPPSRWALTPLCHTSLPFCRWRGTIIYTIRVVASSFHNGTINVSYEPECFGANIGGTSYTSLESCNLDVRPGAELELEIGWSSHVPWLPIDGEPTDPASLPSSGYYNGTLVFTTVRTIECISDSSAYLLIYARAGPDFQVYGVKDDVPAFGYVPVGPAVAQSEGSSLTFAGGRSHCRFGGPPVANVGITEKSAGERIVSLRALLKRYSYMGAINIGGDASSTLLAPKQIITPLPMSPPPYSTSELNGSCMVEWTTISDLYRYFRLAFVGQSGSVRYRIVDGTPERDPSGAACGHASFTMTTSNTLQLDNSPTIVNTQGIVYPSGSVQSDGSVGESGDFRIADVTSLRFTPVGYQTSYQLSNPYLSFPTLSIVKAITNFANANFDVLFAVGDDFSFYNYMGGLHVYLLG